MWFYFSEKLFESQGLHAFLKQTVHVLCLEKKYACWFVILYLIAIAITMAVCCWEEKWKK